MPKLFPPQDTKLIMMHTYFMRNSSTFILHTIKIAFYTFTKTYSSPWNVTTTEYNCKITRCDTDYDQHPLLHEPPSYIQHPAS